MSRDQDMPRSLAEIIHETLHGDPAERIRQITYYRRGYHEAWNYAMDIVFSLLDQGISVKDAYAMMALYEHKLAEWKLENQDEYLDPPSFITREMQEELRQYREKHPPSQEVSENEHDQR